jgi:6-phosphogluconolactonase
MTGFQNADLHIASDAASLAARAADWLLDIAQATRGGFAVALSGGSTPRGLYALLAEPPYREKFPWQRTHWFWGDERFVPYDDPRSNYRMAYDAMFAHVDAPAANIHPIPTEGTPEAAAALYARTLKSFYGADALDPARPLFDVNLLGLGDNGHTASLFPGSPVLAERERWAAAVTGVQPEPRITLTYPVLESCRHAVFLVEGVQKAQILSNLRGGNPTFPAARLHPVGKFHIFADAAAISGQA